MKTHEFTIVDVNGETVSKNQLWAKGQAMDIVAGLDTFLSITRTGDNDYEVRLLLPVIPIRQVSRTVLDYLNQQGAVDV